MFIFSGIYKNAQENKTKICMITENESITYENLKKEIDKKSFFLKSRFKKGEKAIIRSINPINTIVNLLSSAKAGLISIPVDTKILNESLNNIKESTKSFIIMEDNFVYDCIKDEKIFYKDIEDYYLYCNNINSDEIDYNNIFLGALSSGTTGKNKLIWRDHISWTRAFKYQSKVFHISYEDILFLVGSLSYTANLNSAMHILNEGGTIVFSKSIYPKTWIKEMEKNNVTSIFMVPAHYRLLLRELKKNVPNIKSLLSAGAKMDKGTVDLLKERFPKAHICEYYGSSELGHITYINFRENFNKDSVGKPFPGVKIWIEKFKKTIKILEEDKKIVKNKYHQNMFNLPLQKGVIWVESLYIAPEFRAKATAGDIGSIDKKGNLYILGRKDDIINKGGVKIFPYDVENVLNKHPKIIQSVVFGIKSCSKGEEVAVAILAKDSNLTTKEVMNYCRKHLDIHKRPKKINIVSNMKLNLNGKIDKKQLIKDLFY